MANCDFTPICCGESDSPKQEACEKTCLSSRKPGFGLCKGMAVLLVLMASIYATVKRGNSIRTIILQNKVPTPCGEQRRKECMALMGSLVQDGRSAVRYDCSETNIFVFSHRRSGTHMTINLLRYGFQKVRIWKMNHVSCANCTLVKALGNCGLLIHAQRNPLDVAVSSYDYVKGFNPKSEPVPFTTFIRNSSVTGNWSSYTQNCNSISSMIRVDFEMTLSSPERTHRILQEKTGLIGHWNRSKVPKTGAVMFKGGRLGQWGASFDDSSLRYILNRTMSSAWSGGHCACDSKGYSNDGHQCTASMTVYDQ
eukprot:jgi/Picsp_1/3233/NSC_06073-R1_---NA---